MSKLTVIMPVYNAQKFLAEALNSILNQTYSDFILFVIDDGSTDASAEIIEYYKKLDSRIVSFSQNNKGLIKTLNQYFEAVETPYIARMDADDISLPQRFERQIAFLEKHKEIGIVGTGLKYMNETLTKTLEEANFPDSHAKILWKMLYTTGVPHAPVMLRKEIFSKVGGYSEHAKYIEDYDFFHRAKQLTQFANIQETLYVYRKNEQSVSHKFSSEQADNHYKLSKKVIRTIIPKATDDFVSFLKYDHVNKNTDPKQIYSFLEILYQNFTKNYTLTKDDKRFIKNDWIKKLRIFSLTYKSYSLQIGIQLYIKTLIKKYSILT
jgi:glycosyltransferase involved in cell wall biosynthesis